MVGFPRSVVYNFGHDISMILFEKILKVVLEI